MEAKRMSQRLRNLVAAIDKEERSDGFHNDEVERLYELGKDEARLAAARELKLPRYLACASEGHWESGFRANPDFGLGGAEEIEAWLARQYVEGWAGRWVLDLDSGQRLTWATACRLGDDEQTA